MTTTTTDRSPRELIRDTVSQRVSDLQRRYRGDRSGKVPDRMILGQLAALRSAPLDQVGADPDVWGLTLADLPERLAGKGTAPATRAELAVHGATVLFAHLQQGRDERTHQEKEGLGCSVRDLAWRRGDGTSMDASVVKRLHAVALAPNHSQRMRHLFGLIRLMHAERGISIDFGHLADDLYQLQFPDRITQVRLCWGRQLYQIRSTTNQDQ